MRMRSVFTLGILLLFGTAALAQDYPKAEVGLNYSYIRFNAENQAKSGGGFSLNGGSGDVTYNFTRSLGLKAEFGGTTSQTRTFNFSNDPVACPGGGCTVSVQGNLFLYNALLVYKHRSEHFEPFLETGFGGAHTNAYGNVKNVCTGCVFAKSPSNNAFDYILGGGFDVPLTKSVAIRPAQFDFLLTRFGTGFTKGNGNQSNFRYQGGLIFRF